jgi:hypothetical protein
MNVEASTEPRNLGNLNYMGPILLFESSFPTTPCKNLLFFHLSEVKLISPFSFIQNKIVSTIQILIF